MKKIIIESDRESICAGDDVSRHNLFTEFPENITIENLILQLIKVHTIPNGWSVWGGWHDNHICIMDVNGNWLIDKQIIINVFFRDLKKHVFFERSYFKNSKCGEIK